MARVADALANGGLIGIDTSPFIYHLEGSPGREAVIKPFFVDLARGLIQGVTSVVTLLEILVRPYQLDLADVTRDYESFLYKYPHLSVLDIDRDIARDAARLRARYRLPAADSLQLATCLQAGAAAFLTNDRALQRVEELRVLIVDDFR